MNPMMPVISFNVTMADAATRIENAAAEEAAIQRQLSNGCGMLEGYYRAGGVSKVEYEAACVYLRRIANQRIAMLELQRDAAAAGLG